MVFLKTMSVKNKYKNVIYLQISSVLRNLVSIIRGKLVAIFLGVEGLGILGQITTLITVQNRLVSFGIDTVLINRINKINNNTELNRVVFLSFNILIATNLIYLTIAFIFQDFLSKTIFGDIGFKAIFLFTIILGPIYSITYFFEVLSQAKMNFKTLVFGRNVSSIFTIIISIPLIYYLRYYGIIISFIILFIGSGIYFFSKNFENILNSFATKYDQLKNEYKVIVTLGLTDITRKIIVFLSLLVFRVIIIQQLGIEDNGYFQSIWSISFYINIFVGAFVLYYFPSISKEYSREEIKLIINENYNILLYTLFILISVVLIFPEWLLLILYSKDFILMSDSLKILTFLKYFEGLYIFISITLLGQTKLRDFLFVEIIRYSSLIFSAVYFIKYFNFNGIIFSIIIMQISSVVLVLLLSRKNKLLLLSKRNIINTSGIILVSTIFLIPFELNLWLKIAVILLYFFLIRYFIDFNQFIKIIKYFTKS